MLLAAPSTEAQQRGDFDARLALLRGWVTAVEEHEPGKLDSALMTAASWTPADLDMLRTAVSALFELLEKPAARRITVTLSPDTSQSQFQIHGAERVAVFDGAALNEMRPLALRLQHVGVTDFVKRGALFHTDVVTHALDGGEIPISKSTRDSLQYKVRIDDGKLIHVSFSPVHWDVARGLVARIKPTPSTDPWALEWYRATAAFLQNEREWGTGHLTRALEIFPSDAQLLFMLGCVHEALASAAVQAFTSTSTASNLKVNVGTAGRERDAAERFFERAVAANPSFTEARIRLARVLSLRDEHREAAAHLKTALDARPEPLLAFYANLFLGTALLSTQDTAGARDAYTRAAELYPRSQTANLALAALAWRAGERSDMVARLGHAVGGEQRRDADDPWRTYDIVQARRATGMLEAVRELVRRAR
jgi:hypothetical protein